jgi:hypothetical protein
LFVACACISACVRALVCTMGLTAHAHMHAHTSAPTCTHAGARGPTLPCPPLGSVRNRTTSCRHAFETCGCCRPSLLKWIEQSLSPRMQSIL